MNNLELRHVMTAAAVTAAPGMTVAEAHRLMRTRGIHHLPVTDAEGRVLGMIGSHDLFKALIPPGGAGFADRAARLQSCPVSAVMTREVICLPQTATLLEAAKRLQTGAFHALPVVAPGNVLAGIITSTDLVEALRRELDFAVTDAGSALAADEVDAGARPDAAALRALNGLYQATKLYLHSGRGDIEHSRLLRAFEAAREVTERRTQVL
ncbi:MAG: CBS domain-containing protein [Chromatiales bacterium]|nr:CBS domain-containing protein [Chromatiales bacterium]